jgi:hypothetical protein
VPAPTGRTIAVPAGGDLQAALEAAQPGDVVTLANGATYVGNFILYPKAAGGWITVRPASMSGLPAAGERLAPARHAAAMPKIVSPNAMFALATPDWGGMSSRGWHFVGVEVASSPQATYAQAIVQIGTGNETAADQLSSHFVFDRVWIHGRPGPDQVVQRCLSLNSAHSALVDSYVSECHARGMEGQVIQTWGSPGPLKIQNNYLEGGSIGMLVGGADPRIAGLIPSDIEVRGNHFHKPLAWKGTWNAKNAFELKNAQRVLVEGNVFENNWMDAQTGFLVLLTARTQYEQAPWATVRDVTFRYNVLRNSPQGFQITARTSAVQTDVMRRVLIAHNVMERVGGRLFQVSHEVEDLTIAHNSVPHADYMGILFTPGVTERPTRRLVFRDNLLGRGYHLIGSDNARGTGAEALAHYGPDAVVAGNVAFSTVEAGVGRTDQYPTTNAFVADAAAAGVVSATLHGLLVPRAQLSALSLLFRSGTGGATPGADLPEVERRTATAVQP